MKINFYHNLTEPYNTEKAEALIRKSLSHDPRIQLVSVEVSAMRGGDPIYLRIEALDEWGEWRNWPGGYMHLSRYA